eukprot:GHVP01017381.1.p1 GENE.GHVP01017381.1~~GHVP01017381.1.p1  ORF type:complete len:128 (+),score=19.07 GHVP01017381.1:817-1200(+)
MRGGGYEKKLRENLIRELVFVYPEDFQRFETMDVLKKFTIRQYEIWNPPAPDGFRAEAHRLKSDEFPMGYEIRVFENKDRYNLSIFGRNLKEPNVFYRISKGKEIAKQLEILKAAHGLVLLSKKKKT